MVVLGLTRSRMQRDISLTQHREGKTGFFLPGKLIQSDSQAVPLLVPLDPLTPPSSILGDM